MAYYHNLITQKSWQALTALQKELDFVLIGGWAVYLYTKTLKSKDVDIIINFDQLPILKNKYFLNKNDRLKKYEVKQGEIDIDIYLPHYSQIGIPVEKLLTATQHLEGFTLVEPNHLTALKIHTLAQRGHSPKGQKDFIDLIALFRSQQTNLPQVINIINQYHQLNSDLDYFYQFLDQYYQVPELDLNRHTFAKLKNTILQYTKY